MSWLLQTVLLWTWRYMSVLKLLFCLGICPGVELLDHINSIFSFLRNLHTVFRSGCTYVHSYQQYKRAPFTPHLSQHLFITDGLTITILYGVSTALVLWIPQWYLTILLICISLIISDVVHLFMCLLAICLSSLEKLYLGLGLISWTEEIEPYQRGKSGFPPGSTREISAISHNR